MGNTLLETIGLVCEQVRGSARSSIRIGLIVGAAWSNSALSQDTVAIRYLPAHPRPTASMEVVALEIRRHRSSSAPEAKQAIDAFFQAIEGELRFPGRKAIWHHVFPDARSVEATVTINNEVTKLSASSVSPREKDSPESARHRAALRRIVDLSKQHIAGLERGE